MKNPAVTLAFVATITLVGGCIHVTTENEIKPIHITMDVNLKVDRELERQFAGERSGRMSGDFQKVMELLERQAAGLDNMALLVAREGATEQDRKFIDEHNVRRQQRFQEVAKDTGVDQQTVQQRHALRMRERFTVGMWYQDSTGKWCQKQ